MMRREVEAGAIRGIRIAPSAPMVSHLLFADDSSFFIRAKREEAMKIRGLLQKYEDVSGQSVNLDKTTVCFSRGVCDKNAKEIADCSGVRVVHEQDKYLGLPTSVGHSKKLITNIIRDKLSKKLQAWRGSLLSKAGREILIKAVAQSIPTYAMSVFKLPGNFCDELRSLVSRFWWGSFEGKCKISWVAWDKLCKPKCLGGLGFRDYRNFNMALLGKQAWRLITEERSLMVRTLRGKYFSNSSFMDANLGNKPSYTWRGIWEAREVALKGCRRRIGDGVSTRIWKDPWIPSTQTGRVISPRRVADEDLSVAELMTSDGLRWDYSKIDLIFLVFERDRIMNIRLSRTRVDDIWYWEWEKDGIYSVRSVYKILEQGEFTGAEQSDFAREKALWNNIWKIPILPRIKVFFLANL
ncbi:hypothetical protein RND81_14G114300 [Saponaria officinalis]|uniref:Reverse transcriptase n=1 Tax=Saponaria officinalis TaxID=3572 RepID=A0AAW1GNP4_SAPOF